MQLSQNKDDSGDIDDNDTKELKKKKANEDAFKRAVTNISVHNENPGQVCSTLQSIAKKLLKDDEKYRTLHTTNPKVQRRLLKHEGVIDFLQLLGFDLDVTEQKLVCKEKPDQEVVLAAIRVLDSFENRLQTFVHIDSATQVSEVQPLQQSVGRISVVDDSESDNTNLRQIILLGIGEQQRDDNLMEILLMCHKQFSTAEFFKFFFFSIFIRLCFFLITYTNLIKELKRHFYITVSNETKEDEKKLNDFKNKTMKSIQLSVVKNLRNWMRLYWEEDFANDEKVTQVLESWIGQMQIDSTQFPWNGLLADSLQKEWKRCKERGSKLHTQENDYWSVEIPTNLNLYSLSPDELANQITLMDFRIFSSMKSRELMEVWRREDGHINYPSVLRAIQQSNHLFTFVQIQILREKSLNNRGQAITRFIDIGEHFLLNRNFNSLCVIFKALNSAAIHRLKLAWE
ncbi:Ras guanine nucleotide exchange factor, partial [Reticulomyxa filosa]